MLSLTRRPSGFLPREVTPDEAFADDAHGRSVGMVLRGERPARNDREIERPEVGMADDLKVRRRPVAVTCRRISDDLERLAAEL